MVKINKASVIIPEYLNQKPNEHEIKIAWILAKHFNTKIIFLQRNLGYKTKSADFSLHNTEYELKSPESNNRDKIERRMSRGSKQSGGRIIIDYTMNKLSDADMDKIVIAKFNSSVNIRRMIIIKKSGEIFDFSK